MQPAAIAIVVESPDYPALDPRTTRSVDPLGGMLGMRLSLLAGCTPTELLMAFDAMAIFPAWPGKKWPWAEAAKRAEPVRSRQSATVLLGRRVACAVLGDAKGHGAHWYEPIGTFVVAPSPCGKVGLWREERELARARAFWSTLYLEARRVRQFAGAISA